MAGEPGTQMPAAGRSPSEGYMSSVFYGSVNFANPTCGSLVHPATCTVAHAEHGRGLVLENQDRHPQWSTGGNVRVLMSGWTTRGKTTAPRSCPRESTLGTCYVAKAECEGQCYNSQVVWIPSPPGRPAFDASAHPDASAHLYTLDFTHRSPQGVQAASH